MLSRRNFYEDEPVRTLSGTAAVAADAELLAPAHIVNGITVRSIPTVESAVRYMRQSLYCALQRVEDTVNDKKHSVYLAERLVSGAVSALHCKSEDVLPNAAYVAIAGLSGNIMARQRGVVAKVVLPVALSAAAFRYFLPQTFANTAGFLWAVEKRTAPALAEQQVAVVAQASTLVAKAEQVAADGLQRVHAGVDGLRTRIGRATGLTLDEDVLKKRWDN